MPPRKHNEVIINGDTATIICRDKSGEVKALVDTEDLERLTSEYCLWRIKRNSKSVYIHAKVVGEERIETLHRAIMNAPEGTVVDHIDRDTLNNTKRNLRITTHTVNSRNTVELSSHNTSGYRGVNWHKSHKKWRACIHVNNKSIHLGYYDNLEDAIFARKQAEVEYWGNER